MEYRVLTGKGADELEKIVQKHINEGWSVSGGVSMIKEVSVWRAEMGPLEIIEERLAQAVTRGVTERAAKTLRNRLRWDGKKWICPVCYVALERS